MINRIRTLFWKKIVWLKSAGTESALPRRILNRTLRREGECGQPAEMLVIKKSWSSFRAAKRISFKISVSFRPRGRRPILTTIPIWVLRRGRRADKTWTLQSWNQSNLHRRWRHPCHLRGTCPTTHRDSKFTFLIAVVVPVSVLAPRGPSTRRNTWEEQWQQLMPLMNMMLLKCLPSKFKCSIKEICIVLGLIEHMSLWICNKSRERQPIRAAEEMILSKSTLPKRLGNQEIEVAASLPTPRKTSVRHRWYPTKNMKTKFTTKCTISSHWTTRVVSTSSCMPAPLPRASVPAMSNSFRGSKRNWWRRRRRGWGRWDERLRGGRVRGRGGAGAWWSRFCGEFEQY